MEVVRNGQPAPTPTILQQAKNLGVAIKDTANLMASGQKPLASKEVYDERKAVCEKCMNWEPRGFNGLGRCIACGCSGFKLNLAASKCPINLWKR